jgi:hypothetical protein
VSDDVLARRGGESAEAYLGRLGSVDRAALDEDGQLALALSLALARKKLSRATAARLASLHDCKEAIRNLSPPEREDLARWLARGMPD